MVGGEKAERGSLWSKWGSVCSALLLLACVLVWWKGLSFSVTGTLSEITSHEMKYTEEGDRDKTATQDEPRESVVYVAPAPPVYVGHFFMLPVGRESNLELFENGQPMTRVVWKGDVTPGAYFHLADQVHFLPLLGLDAQADANSSDLSRDLFPQKNDSRSNDLTYTFHARYFLRLRYQVALCGLMLLCGIGLGLAGRGVSSAGRDVRENHSKRGRLGVLLNSRPLVLLAASLAPFLFFLSRNAFFYSYGAIFTSLGVLLCLAGSLSLVLFVLCRFLSGLVDRISDRLSEGTVLRLRLLPDVFWACAACSIFVLFCGFSIKESLSDWMPWFSVLLFGASLSSALASASVLRWGIQTQNAFLFSFLLVTSVSLLGDILWKSDRQQEAFPLGGNKEISLTEKPNIYVFFLESYAGSDAMREFYDIDATPFYQELEKRGFLVRDTYSNQTFTVASAATLMMMQHLNVQKSRAGLLDTQRGIRAMLCGAEYNPVFDILKRNGYRISFLLRDFVLCPQPSPAIDLTNLSYTSVFRNFQPLIDATGILVEMTTGDRPDPEQFEAKSKALIQQSLGRPTFHFIYTGLAHNVPEANSEWRSYWKNEYRRLRAIFNPKLLDQLDFIGKVDPDGLIVLIGDHGSKLFGNLFSIDNPGYPELARMGVCTHETVARDQGSILFAIKSPASGTVWKNRLVTHVNLFRYVFAMLSGDETLLEHPEPDVCLSWDGKYIIARDGQPLKEWEPVDPKLFLINQSGQEVERMGEKESPGDERK
jgi:hypothetical protein